MDPPLAHTSNWTATQESHDNIAMHMYARLQPIKIDKYTTEKRAALKQNRDSTLKAVATRCYQH